MKIAFVVRNYHKSGGISGYVAELAELYARDHEVHVYAASFKDVDNFGIKCHKIPILTSSLLVRWKKHALNNLLEVWSFALTSFFYVNSKDFDIVHSQGDYWGQFDVYTVHSCHKAWLEIASENASLWQRLLKSKFNPLHANILLSERHCLKNARRVIAISEVTKREVMKYYNVPESKITIVPHGVDIERFNIKLRDVYRAKIREKHGLSEQDMVIVFPAHEFKRKGLPQIIEALHTLNMPTLYVLVVGKDNPSDSTRIAEKYGLAQKIIFAGATSGIERYYCAADMMVFPTSYEPFGMIITEAMACGLPVVVSKLAGAAELITDGVDGVLLHDHTDVGSISGAIKLLALDKPMRMRMGEKALALSEKYTWSLISDITMSLYRRITNPVLMNICVVTRTTLFHSMGGMEQHLRMLVEGLVKIGHRVTVITTAHPGHEQFIEKNGVSYHFLKGAKPGRYSRRLAARTLRKFKQLHSLDPFDVIHSESMGPGGLLAASVNKKFLVPIVVIFHGIFINEIETCLGILFGRTGTIVRRLYAVLAICRQIFSYIRRQFTLVRRANAVIATSMKQKMLIKRYFQLPDSRVLNVFNGVDIVPADEKDINALKVKIGIGTEPVVLCIARLKLEKGIHVAIKAFAEIVKNRPARLVIVGDGEYRTELEGLVSTLGIADKVFFAGIVDYSELGVCYAVADVFVNATIRENGYDLTIAQAMGYKRSLIVTQLKALEGVIEDNVNGLLVRKGDPLDLASKINYILDHPEKASAMALKAYATYDKNFTAEQMVRNTTEVYQKAIASRKRGHL